MRGVTFPNRIVVAPMCQYSSTNGLANDWHMVHLGSRAVGGAGLVFTEAAAVSPEGRITPSDLGIWSDAHVDVLRPITQFIASQGSLPGIQLAHAGRRGARTRPWDGHTRLDEDKTWTVLAPQAIAFDEGWQTPHEMDTRDLDEVVQQFVAAAKRSHNAGFEVLELHMAHGYLLHSFLSPLTNRRADSLGGDLRARASYPLRIAKAVREAWPSDFPLFVRLSVVDWTQDGLNIDESIQISRWMKDVGVDLIDCSSGALVPGEKIPFGYPFQVPFAARIRKEAHIPTGAVGCILEPAQAEAIIANKEADLIFLARALLNDPYWPRHAAPAGRNNPNWPIQYARAVRHFHDAGWRPNALGPGQSAK
jgi:2,4-dienoyl-CoA reductase-like NADH-dependent reductase (Old Yellow Enzyme family)